MSFSVCRLPLRLHAALTTTAKDDRQPGVNLRGETQGESDLSFLATANEAYQYLLSSQSC